MIFVTFVTCLYDENDYICSYNHNPHIIMEYYNQNRSGNGQPVPPPYEGNNYNDYNYQQPVPPRKSGQSIGMKILFIAIITAVLMIPDLIISSLVSDREHAQDATINEISYSWSGPQLISGPVLSIPYDSICPDDRGGVVRLLPETMDFKADVKSQVLHRSIYECVVYNSDVVINGSFSIEPLRKLGIPMSAYRFGETQVTIGIGDLRGVEEISPLKLGGKEYELEGGRNLQVYSSNDDVVVYGEDLNIRASSGCMESTGILLAGSDSVAIPYNVTMKLRGSRSLGTAPVGRRNEIAISGECKSPSFTGMFLPSDREVKDGNFTASWTLNSTNRDYPQAFIGDRAEDIASSAVMVDMLVPVDRYQKTDRALKYAVIVILLTFIAVLFAEIMMKHPINMFQYLLIGLALVLFYSLLLSLSEHLSFGLSYLIASVMTIGLVAIYMRGVLKSPKIAIAIGALLTIIYVFIYILLCLETFALLTGSLGLFIALAAIMYATLKLRIENKE